MDSIATLHRVAVVLLLVGGVGYGQSSLPATSPTAIPVATPVADPAAAAARAPHAAKVSYAEGQLEINADNSSLNQILREVSRQTGMKITGGVNDERVFGKYGPSTTAEVLTSLLRGTGSNMLLMAGSGNGTGELILSPRQGGPTPPNPNAPGFDDGETAADEAPPNQSQPVVRPTELPRARPPFMPPPPPGAGSGGAAGTTLLDTSQSTSAAPSDASASPSSGAKTPEQIYQQLQEIQRQKQAQQPSTPH